MTILTGLKIAKQNLYFILLIAFMVSACNDREAKEKVSDSNQTSLKNTAIMTDSSITIELFNKWERVWHEGQYNLIPDCVGDTYERHDQKGDRIVTRAEYSAEIEQVHKERPGIRVVVYDHVFKGNLAWFRFAFKWIDPKTEEPRSIAGFQSYRIEGGKLVETWLSLQPLGSAWPDKVAQEHWTSQSPKD